MGTRVKRVRTTVSEPEMAQALINGWRELVGTIPTKQQIAMLLSQNALETANRKSMWNYNIGNITTTGKGAVNYFDDLATDEQIKPGKWVKMNLKYKAYPTLQEGVKDYLRLLKTKYSAAWQNIVNPDPVAFSKALKQKGYYTANEAPYTKALSTWYKKFNKSDSYELAQAGKVPSNNVTSINKVDSILNNYIKMIAATEKKNKKLYKKYLPYNNACIIVQANNFTDGVEFANVLCSVLEEELLAKAHTHTDGFNIEVECTIPGPSTECFNLLQQITEAAAESFHNATRKIGGVAVINSVIINKKSSYRPITFKIADSQHRQFLLKFI